MEYIQEVESVVRSAIRGGAANLGEIYRQSHGADPRLIYDNFHHLLSDALPSDLDATFANELRQTHTYPQLPAANPLLGQWWFRQDTANLLADLIHDLAPIPCAVGFLGAPTAAHAYSYKHGSAKLFDADPDIYRIVELNGANKSEVVIYDANDQVPPQHKRSCKAVLLDPPWYIDSVICFLSRASEIVQLGGHVLCSLPPRLTRSTIEAEKAALMRWLGDSGMELVSLEPQRLTYLVPEFESAAFEDLPGFDHKPWRRGDLLHVRLAKEVRLAPAACDASVDFVAYSLDPAVFRVFMKSGLSKQPLGRAVKLDPAFEKNVSRRTYNHSSLGIWTSANKGGAVSDPGLVQLCLEQWQMGHDREHTANALVATAVMSDSEAREFVGSLAFDLGIWMEPAQRVAVHDDKAIAKRLDKSLNRKWAACSHKAKRLFKVQQDGFRIAFQRDRDRVVWSHGFRRLANKTQVFSTQRDGNVRQRLAHSIEVMQLAQTIGRSFGLHPDLIEAGSLVHDIGHTPFGHAGEFALDRTLDAIDGDLCGFNHYEHGVDVVRYLEDAYQSPASGGFPGLNLTNDVAECILKHTFYRNGYKTGQTELFNRSKHQDYFDDSPCHLEGQAIRLADKVSYLISDIEDGIRMGVFTEQDLLGCHLFNIPPIDIVTSGESLYERFISQRRIIIKVLMEDLIEATERRLAKLNNAAAVRKVDEYTIGYSERMERDTDEVWGKLQAGKLHKDARVQMANVQSGKIISELLVLFALFPDLVDVKFRAAHDRLQRSSYLEFYRLRVGKNVRIPESIQGFISRGSTIGQAVSNPDVAVENLILAKDYVASLTDSMARAFHVQFLSSD